MPRAPGPKGPGLRSGAGDEVGVWLVRWQVAEGEARHSAIEVGGLGAEDGVHFAIEGDDAGLANRALALLGDRAGSAIMGACARRFVVDNLSWPAALASLPALVGRAPKEQGRRDAA